MHIDADIPINIELGEHGLYYGTSPAMKGLLVTGDSVEKVMEKVPSAIAEMREVGVDDLCHAADSSSGETSSAQAPLQTDLIREALEAERDRLSKLTAEKLELQKIDAYLRVNGWTNEPYGEFGVGWINGPSYGVMPTTPKVGDYRIRMRQLIETVAYHEQRPIHAVLFAIDATEATSTEAGLKSVEDATPSSQHDVADHDTKSQLDEAKQIIEVLAGIPIPDHRGSGWDSTRTVIMDDHVRRARSFLKENGNG